MPTHVRRLLSVCAVGIVLSVGAGAARAAEGGDADEARAFHEKAKAAFALSHYAQAAEFFEKAFELKSDPALLYNAAQSHRLAGNKERALTLYQNYLRVYGRDDRRGSIDSRIEELKRAIEHDRVSGTATSPATTNPAPAGTSKAVVPLTPVAPRAPVAGSSTTPRPSTPAPAPAPATMTTTTTTTTLESTPAPLVPVSLAPTADNGSASPVLLTRPGESAGDDRSITRKPWFWLVIGGGVAVAAAAVLFVTLSKSKDPSASLGSASGN